MNSAKPVGLFAVGLLALVCAQPLRGQSQPIQYFYDDLGRLVTVVDSSGNVATYVYDAVGNILQINRSTVAPGSLAIFDFNPERGPWGTSVTIRGQGFSATASSDIVNFNGTVAKNVTFASTSTLTATVPVGATTGPISVTVGSQTATSAANFVVTQPPVIQSIFPKSALFNVVIPSFQVTGSNLLGANFFFSSGQLTISNVSVARGGTSASMTVAVGTTPGTFALVAMNSYGSSGDSATPANRFTIVDPNSIATSACGIPDVIEAAYGLDSLDPNSCPTWGSIPLLGGEVDSAPFSVLNTAPPRGSPDATIEADALPFSVLNTAPPSGSQSATEEADGIFFSVQNNAGSARQAKEMIPETSAAHRGNEQTAASPDGRGSTRETAVRGSAGGAAQQSRDGVPLVGPGSSGPEQGAVARDASLKNH